MALTAVAGHPQLLGREAELTELRALVDGARAGASAVRVVVEPPGIGKTSLLRSAFDDVDGITLVVVDGVETDADLAHSAGSRFVRHQGADQGVPGREAAARA